LNILEKNNRRGLPLGWDEGQDGGVMKGEIPQGMRVLSQTTTALLEDRWRALCTAMREFAI
jgi:hypothetical protein